MSFLAATDLVLHGKVRVTAPPIFFMYVVRHTFQKKQQQKHYLVFTTEN